MRIAWLVSVPFAVAGLSLLRTGGRQTQPAPTRVARLACTADTNLSSYETETLLNYGASPRIRLKGIQMLGVFQFDLKPVSGMVIERARLHLRYAGTDRKLRTLGFSTVAVPWTEGAGRGDRVAGATCFASPELGVRHWTTKDSDFTDAAFLPEASLVSYSDVRNDGDGRLSAEIDPRIVQAMLAGLSYGLAVTDEKGQTMANNDVFAREQYGSAPYLSVEYRKPTAAETRVGALAHLRARPAPEWATTATSAAQLDVTIPTGSIGIEAAIRIAGEGHARKLPETVVGLMPRSSMTAHLDDLPGNAAVTIMARPVGMTGLRGPWSSSTMRTPRLKPRPGALKVPSSYLRLGSCPGRRLGPLTVSVTRADVRLDPDTGEPDQRLRDHLWNGRAIYLQACRGERVGITVSIASRAADGTAVVRCRPTAPPATGVRYATYRVLPVRSSRRIADLCIPAAETRSYPSARVSQWLVEFDVLPSQPSGIASFSLDVASEGHGSVRFPVQIAVLPPALQTRLGFEVSLNTYGSPARAAGLDPASADGLRSEQQYHRLAHEHRCTLTPLGYSHSGTLEPGYAPNLSGSGANRAVTSWAEWDKRFVAYLNGEAFVGLPRDREPITHFYLPFHEAWPEDIRRHYAYTPPAPAYPQIIADHAMAAGPIEQMMSSEYSVGFQAIVRAFREHIRQVARAAARAQFYLNNKYYYRDPASGGRGTSWWLLDEPMHRDDWLALAWFGRLLKTAVKSPATSGSFRSADTTATAGDAASSPDASRASIVFRADISRPQWQRDYLDGLVDLMVVNDEMYARPTLMRRIRRRLGVTFWHYGEAPAPDRVLTAFEEWPLRACLAGADGIVPWQTIGTAANTERAEATALIVPGNRIGHHGPLATLRLKALGRGAQDVELIRALARSRGWSREQTRLALTDLIEARDGEALRAAVRDALRDQPSPASQALQSDGHSAAAPARRPSPKP